MRRKWLYIAALLFAAAASAYDRKCELVIQESQLNDAGTYTGFVVLLTVDNLPSELFDSDGSYPARSDAGDLEFFSDSNLSTELTAVEIVSFSQNANPALGTAEIYVQCTPIGNADTSIWVSWDGTTDNSGGRTSPWGDYVSVYHMDESSGSLLDSTATGLNLTSVGGTPDYQQTGKIGYGINFTAASNEYFSVATAAITAYPFTILAWFKSDSATDFQDIVWIGDKDSPEVDISVWARGDVAGDPVNGAIRTSGAHKISQSTTGYSTASFSQVAYVGASTTSRIVYLNGGNSGDNTVSTAVGTNNSTAIGMMRDSSPGVPFDGIIDEVWIADTAFDAYWISALYNTQNAPSTFVIEGTPTDVVADTIAISTPEQYQTFQRVAGVADIAITGTYSGTPTAIEASFNGGAYATIDAAPSGGSYSGTLLAQDAGQGTLTVRYTNDTGVTATQTYIGIGDVFLVVGQSNAAGRGTNNQSYSHATLKATKFMQTADAWAELTDPSHDSASAAGSAWPLLATLHMADQSVPVAFITAAVGATGLVTSGGDWDPDGVGNTYDACIAQVTSSGVNAIAAILWYQGEQDAYDGITQSAYNAALDALYAGFATNLPGADPPLICVMIGNMQNGVTTAAEIDAIRFAQVDAWDDNAGIYPGPVLIDIDLSDGGGDGIHLKTDVELDTFADRMWAAIDEALFDGTAGRGPVVASSFCSNDYALIRFDKSLAPSVAITTTLFGLTDNGGSVAVDDVSAIGDFTQVVTSQTLVAPVSLSYGSGNSAAGATVLRGIDANALPAEPFSITPSTSGGNVIIIVED